MIQRKRREIPQILGWILIGCTAIFFSHISNFGLGSAWLMRAAIVVGAAALIAERGEFRWLRDAVILCAVFQIPVIALQILGVQTPWPVVGPHPAGTVMKRGAMSILLGMASLWSVGWKAVLFAALSCLTGSFAGSIPAVIRIIYQLKPTPIILCLFLGMAVASVPLAWDRIVFRVEVLSSLSFLKVGWLNGYGFLPLPGGFQEDAGGLSPAHWNAVLRDYHSTWVDWIARFGLIGVLLWAGVFLWVLRRVRKGASWGRWTLFFVLFAGAVQSSESFTFMTMILLVFLIGLCYEREVKSVDTV